MIFICSTLFANLGDAVNLCGEINENQVKFVGFMYSWL